MFLKSSHRKCISEKSRQISKSSIELSISDRDPICCKGPLALLLGHFKWFIGHVASTTKRKFNGRKMEETTKQDEIKKGKFYEKVFKIRIITEKIQYLLFKCSERDNKISLN